MFIRIHVILQFTLHSSSLVFLLLGPDEHVPAGDLRGGDHTALVLPGSHYRQEQTTPQEPGGRYTIQLESDPYALSLRLPSNKLPSLRQTLDRLLEGLEVILHGPNHIKNGKQETVQPKKKFDQRRMGVFNFFNFIFFFFHKLEHTPEICWVTGFKIRK